MIEMSSCHRKFPRRFPDILQSWAWDWCKVTVTLTFDQQTLVSSCLNPMKVFPKCEESLTQCSWHYVRKTEDGRATKNHKYNASSHSYRQRRGIKRQWKMAIATKVKQMVLTNSIIISWIIFYIHYIHNNNEVNKGKQEEQTFEKLGINDSISTPLSSCLWFCLNCLSVMCLRGNLAAAEYKRPLQGYYTAF